MEVEPGRKLSPAHEARWLSLLGFSLRPGFGMAVDDWRMAQTRRLLSGLIHNNPTCRAEWWILWRRVAGGLPSGQQRSLAQPLIADVRSLHRAVQKKAVPGIQSRLARGRGALATCRFAGIANDCGKG